MRGVYEPVAPLLAEAGMMSQNARAGCVRCQACSALSTFERAFGGGRDGEAAPAAARLMSCAAATFVRVRLAAHGRRARGPPRVRRAVFVDEQGIFAGTTATSGTTTALHVIAAIGGASSARSASTRSTRPACGRATAWRCCRRAAACGVGAPLVRFAVATAGELGGHAHDRPHPGAQRRLLPAPRVERAGRPDLDYRGATHQEMTIPLAGAQPEFAPAGYAWALGT